MSKIEELELKKEKKCAFLIAGSRRSNARLSMVDFMPFSRDLSQEQLIGCVNKRLNCKTVTNMSGIPGISFYLFFLPY